MAAIQRVTGSRHGRRLAAAHSIFVKLTMPSTLLDQLTQAPASFMAETAFLAPWNGRKIVNNISSSRYILRELDVIRRATPVL